MSASNSLLFNSATINTPPNCKQPKQLPSPQVTLGSAFVYLQLKGLMKRQEELYKSCYYYSKAHKAVHSWKPSAQPNSRTCWITLFCLPFSSQRGNCKNTYFTGLEHVLLEIAISYMTKIKFNKDKTLYFQYEHTTQLLDDIWK